MRGVARTLLFVIAAFSLLPGAAFAQGPLTGVVEDTSGPVLPGVTVEAATPVWIERSARRPPTAAVSTASSICDWATTSSPSRFGDCLDHSRCSIAANLHGPEHGTESPVTENEGDAMRVSPVCAFT